MIGASEVLASCAGWLMVSASSTTSCRDLASSNMRSISLCTSAVEGASKLRRSPWGRAYVFLQRGRGLSGMADGKEPEGQGIPQGPGQAEKQGTGLTGVVLASPGAGREAGQDCEVPGKRKVGGRVSGMLERAEKQETGASHQCWSGRRSAR